MKDEILVNKVCEQIKEDLFNNDESALYEMILRIASTNAKTVLVGYLSEDGGVA